MINLKLPVGQLAAMIQYVQDAVQASADDGSTDDADTTGMLARMSEVGTKALREFLRGQKYVGVTLDDRYTPVHELQLRYTMVDGDSRSLIVDIHRAETAEHACN